MFWGCDWWSKTEVIQVLGRYGLFVCSSYMELYGTLWAGILKLNVPANGIK